MIDIYEKRRLKVEVTYVNQTFEAVEVFVKKIVRTIIEDVKEDHLCT